MGKSRVAKGRMILDPVSSQSQGVERGNGIKRGGKSKRNGKMPIGPTEQIDNRKGMGREGGRDMEKAKHSRGSKSEGHRGRNGIIDTRAIKRSKFTEVESTALHRAIRYS